MGLETGLRKWYDRVGGCSIVAAGFVDLTSLEEGIPWCTG
jgi:hypothetical protein